MKKRLTAWMIVLFVPLLAGVFLLFLQQSFSQTLQREQERAQMTEGMIYLQVHDMFDDLTYAQGVEVARSYRNLYATQGVELIFLYNGQPVAGAVLPGDYYQTLLIGSRAALLDTQGAPQRYAIADPLRDNWTLLTLRDVSDLYILRDHLRNTALWFVLGAGLLAALLSYRLASWFTAPIKRLTKAVHAMQRGDFMPALLPKASRDEVGTLSLAFLEMHTVVLEREHYLEQESQNRQRLLDALAHEMRTPLCALLGNTRLLQNPAVAGAVRHQLAEEMARDIKRLSDMDTQLMKLTELAHEQPHFSPVAVLPLLRDTVQRVEHQAHGVTLAVAGQESVVPGDGELLSMLADNLTLNAVRASKPGDTVTLQSLQNGFTIMDSGIGMTAEQLAHAQEPFYKADPARTRKAGGVGLGLTLCRQIAALHRGTLTIISAPGVGTTVTFTTTLQPDADLATTQDVSFTQEVSPT
ncbi:MAG TPA: HAMP domain-containing sensor histidine kinase [Candidatus Limiplasma sp.]|nr:HAMP domain-containing sensor histidine kinase [Candidatus Limiplasma sp.]HPS80348.1 HAMP domain-containing sensor histidine kinase [Candidatus Limiplasma sp.]